MFQMAKISYKISDWRRMLWLSDTRFYQAELKQDLFGDWILERHWAGRWQKNGRVVTEVLDSLDDGLMKLEATHKKRMAHGYQLIEDLS